MYNHAPDKYICPICLGVQGVESSDTLLKPADLVFQDELVSVFINSFWVDTARGHVIVVPNQHFENIFDLPLEVGYRLSEVIQKMSLAMKVAYQCDGITTRQNNGPAGDQHAFHYHHHIFPRYDGDSFNLNLTKKSILSDPKDRIAYVQKLKLALEKL